MNLRKIPVLLMTGGAALVSAACASAGRSSPEMTLSFPLPESARIPCRAPIVPKLVEGPRGLVLVMTKDGYLQALDLEKNAVRWEYMIDSAETAPVVADGRIVCASGSGRICGVSPEGKTVWENKAGEPIRGDILAVGTQVVYREGDSTISALKADDGTPLWRISDAAGTDFSGWGNRIVFGAAEGSIRILNADGGTFRRIETGGKIVGRPGVQGDRVYVGLEDGRFQAYDPATGRRYWSVRLGGIPVAARTDGRRILYAALSTNLLVALDLRRGDLLWWRPLSGRAEFPPFVFKNRVFIASQAPLLQVFEPAEGKAEVAFNAKRDILAPTLAVGLKLCLALGGEKADQNVIVVLSLAPPATKSSPTITFP